MSLVEKERRFSNAWLLGATLGGYLIIAFVGQFWGEGLLFPANDIGTLNRHATRTNWETIFFVAVGVVVTFLGVLQELLGVELSRRWTRVALWLNFVPVACSIYAAFGTALIGSSVLQLAAVAIVMVAFPLGLVVSVVNVVGSCFRKPTTR